MRFASPWVLLVLLAVPLILYFQLFRHRRGSIRFSSILHAGQSGRSAIQQIFRLPLLIRVLLMVLLALALARPQEGTEKVFEVSKGIAIEMVVDRSGSMGAEMEFDGGLLTRLDVVKSVFAEFINGNDDELTGRPNDLVGMITFARYSDTICPLTLAHGVLSRFLENVKLVTRKSEDGTAIGDALALAAARLKTAEETLSGQGSVKDDNYEIKSKIIILLTDGENNMGSRSPMQAAALAKEWGIKIYTVGVGVDAVIQVQTPFGLRRMRAGRGVDRKTLKALAEATGGVFRMAEDGDALREIYQEINQLEKSEVESVRWIDYREFFTIFATIALALLVLEIIMNCTIFRKIP